MDEEGSLQGNPAQHLRDGGDTAAARAGCFSTRDLVGSTFPTVSLVFQLPKLGLLGQNEVSCAVHLPWDTCRVTAISLAGRVRRALERILSTRALLQGQFLPSRSWKTVGTGWEHAPKMLFLVFLTC